MTLTRVRRKEVRMKIVLVGANGTIGKYVRKALLESKNEVITVGKNSGDYRLDIESAESIKQAFQKIGSFDALVNASGDVAFAPFEKLTSMDWQKSLASKLMGQINLVTQAIPFMNERGSITLVSGILAEEPIFAGVAASTVNAAVQGFVRAAATELPKGLRINVVSPNLLEDSVKSYGDFFPGFIPVSGNRVAAAFKKSVMGVQTGQTFTVF